ncbi:hypothetical protein L914_14187, partial [Phytophthora nicotianae]
MSPDQFNYYIFYHGAYPLWKYLKLVLDIDLVDVCAYVAKEEPVLHSKKVAKLAARITTEDTEPLGRAFNDDVVFLLNSINTVFNALRCGVERDGEKVLATYKFDLDATTNHIRLDTGKALDEHRIAI